jgi:hypothetical protein
VERILEVSDLAALPIGRAVVFASGTRPILVQTEPWYSGPHADRIRAAMARPKPVAVNAWTGYDLQPGTPKRDLKPGTQSAAVRAAITRKALPSSSQEPE